MKLKWIALNMIVYLNKLFLWAFLWPIYGGLAIQASINRPKERPQKQFFKVHNEKKCVKVAKYDKLSIYLGLGQF